jgi:hypothetical protein
VIAVSLKQPTEKGGLGGRFPLQLSLCNKSLLTSFSLITGGCFGRAFSCSVRVYGWRMAILDLYLLVYCWLLHTIGDGVSAAAGAPSRVGVMLAIIYEASLLSLLSFAGSGSRSTHAQTLTPLLHVLDRQGIGKVTRIGGSVICLSQQLTLR